MGNETGSPSEHFSETVATLEIKRPPTREEKPKPIKLDRNGCDMFEMVFRMLDPAVRDAFRARKVQLHSMIPVS